MVLLIDTNILLDILQYRMPFYDASKKVINLCGRREADGHIALHSVSNIYFILRKQYSSEERRMLLEGILKVLRVCGAEHEKVVNALKRKDFTDFEDCLQDECAASINASYIITRNISDFKNSKVKAVTPEQFLDITMWNLKNRNVS